MKLRISNALLALLAGAVLWGCTTNAAGVTPGVTTGPLGGTLEVAVGTVNYGGLGPGLNVVETFRGSNGFTAVPVNTGTLTGPAGFAGVAGSGDPGAGLAAIPLGSQFNAFTVGPNATNLDAADAFGVGPPGSSTTTANPFPWQPQFGDVAAGGGLFPAVGSSGPAGETQVYGGVPAYPAQSGGVLPGYPEMFYLVALSALPPTGTYNLAVSFSQNGTSSTTTATASLASNSVLPNMPAPGYVADAGGGGTVSVTNPAGVTESLVNITDASGGIATVVTHGAGPQTATVPDGTFVTGDTLTLQAFGFDYNDYELGSLPPSRNPVMPAQADVTISAQSTATALGVHHHLGRRAHTGHH